MLEDQYNGGADPAQVLLELAEFTHLATRLKLAPDDRAVRGADAGGETPRRRGGGRGSRFRR